MNLEGKKTYLGIAAVVIAELGRMFGVDLGDGTDLIASVITLIGAALAIYGRLTAKPKEPTP